jgi:pilus assembly protein CpaC
MIAARTTQFWRMRHVSRRPAAFFAALVVFIIVILVAAPEAQQAQSPAFTPAVAAGPGGVAIDPTTTTDIDLLVGRSTILNVGTQIVRVSLTVPDVADAMVTSPGQLLIHGKSPGTISLFVWDKSGAIRTFEVNVRRDLSSLVEYLKQLFPGEQITVVGSGKDVVLSGTVSSKYVVEKAADVAGGYVEKKENVVNLLKQQEGVASNQVMLRVRFAEVSRSALQELGVNFVANGFKTDWFGRTTTGQFAAPDFDSDRGGGLVFSDFLNIFVFNAKEGLGAVVRALQNKGLFQSLAEPNLISINGKEASFLAGGEYPYPIVQPSSGGNAVTIQFKEFGIRLNFTPTVLGGDLINLKVKPEVSALDFSNALTLAGFRIPAISTRRTETEVELRDGQTFAIAGLMNNTLNETMSKIPGIGDIPVLGLLFRSRAHQKNQTELVVMITPTIVKRGQMGVSEGLPSLVAPYMGRPDHSLPNPDPYVGSPRYPAGSSSSDNNNAPAPAPATKPSKPAATKMPEATKPSNAKPEPTKPTNSKPAASPATTMTTPKSGATTSGTATPSPSTAFAPLAPSSTPTSVPMTPSPAQTGPAAMPTMPGTPNPNGPASAPPVPGTASTPGSQQPWQMPAQPSMPPTAPVTAPSAPTSQATTTAAPKTGSAPASKPLTKDQQKLIEKAKEQEKRAAEAEAKEKADAQRKAEADKKQADKIAKERAAREAEVARKKDAETKRQADENQKREKALSDAAARLKEAQSAYEAELQKAKGGTDEKSTEAVRYPAPSTSKQ